MHSNACYFKLSLKHLHTPAFCYLQRSKESFYAENISVRLLISVLWNCWYARDSPTVISEVFIFLLMSTTYRTSYNNKYNIVLLVNDCLAQCTLLIRPHPSSLPIHLHYNCHINEVKSSKTCLPNQTESISCHIRPLVIYALRGDTHTTH